jgi:hypothetical protein
MTARRVNCDYLTIQHGKLGLEGLNGTGHLWEGLCQIIASTGNDLHPVSLLKGHAPVAVQLQLIQPVRAYW